MVLFELWVLMGCLLWLLFPPEMKTLGHLLVVITIWPICFL